MKTIDDRISVNAVCFSEVTLDQLVSNWREIGSRRVSLISLIIAKADAGLLRRKIEKEGHKVETIMHPLLGGGNLDENEIFPKARKRLQGVIQTASVLGARSIYMVAGGRGSLTWEEAAERFCEVIEPCKNLAEAEGISLLVENSPALYADVHIAHSLRDAIKLAEMADIGVVIDVFGCWTEAGLQDAINRAMPRCKLIQLSDYVYGDRAYPCRAVPGDGVIPLGRILTWASSAGFTGAYDLELVGPRIEREGSVKAVRRAAENVTSLLGSIDVHVCTQLFQR